MWSIGARIAAPGPASTDLFRLVARMAQKESCPGLQATMRSIEDYAHVLHGLLVSSVQLLSVVHSFATTRFASSCGTIYSRTVC